MGNPTMRPQPISAQALHASPPTEHNGILGRIGGEYVGQGSQDFPPASATEGIRTTELDVPGQGRVRLTYMPRQYHHRRRSYWTWLVTRADLVDVNAQETPTDLNGP